MYSFSLAYSVMYIKNNFIIHCNKHIFRHFEEWKFNGETFDVVELEAKLDEYWAYPESFYVDNNFCH